MIFLLYSIYPITDLHGENVMTDFEIILGDAIFAVELRSMSQNSSNTEINLPHFHIDNELHIVLDGAATMRLDTKDIPTRAGDIYIIPPSACHYYEDYTESFNKISCLFTLAKGRDNSKGFSEYEYYNKIFGSLKECVFVSDRSTLDIAERLFALDISEQTEHIYKTLYALLFISVARLIEKRLSSTQNNLPPEGAGSNKIKEQKKTIELFLRDRCGENVTVEDLAKLLYRSVPQTHRIIKKYFGDSFKRILTKQRMEKAFVLINESKLSLGEIAILSGYASYGGFLAAFKKYVGKAPEEYRKSVSR